MSYIGKEVCQGCKKTGKESQRTNKNDLCWVCEDVLKLGNAVSVELKFKYTYVSQYWHALKCVGWEGYSLNKPLNKFLKSIHNEYAERDGAIIGLCGKYYDNSYSAIIPTVFVEPIRELFDSLNKLIKEINDSTDELPKTAKKEVVKLKDEIFNKGVEKGRDLLFQLNNGSITIDDFNDKLSYKG